MIRSSHVRRSTASAALVFCCFSIACSSQSEERPAAPAESPAASPSNGTASASTVSGRAPAAVNGFPSIVILAPVTPREFPPASEKPYMDQITLTFTPAVLFVRTGQPTDFRNSDDVLHNVRVRSEATKEGLFNVAIPTGGNYEFTFERDGFYDVGCDIHPGMSAQVIASSSPYATMADAQGNFAFENVEPGSYVVTYFTGTQKVEKPIEVTAPRTDLGS
jgi:plastocyanin